MKTLKKIFLFVVLLFSVGLAQQKDVVAVNGWNFNGSSGIIDSEKTKTAIVSSTQVFSTYGATKHNGGWYIQSSWRKTFGEDGNYPLIPDTLAVKCKLNSVSGNVSEVWVYYLVQDPYVQFSSGLAGKISLNSSSWQEFKVDMNARAKTFMKYIFKIYLDFVVASLDSSYVGADVAVSKLWGIDDTLGVVVYDYFGDSPTGVSELEQIPKGFVLYQNYPNPFNPSTTIRFSVPKREHVNLTVLNLLGQEVKILVNEEKGQGSYEVSFDASNLPSGIYLYRLRVGARVEVKKMVLLK